MRTYLVQRGHSRVTWPRLPFPRWTDLRDPRRDPPSCVSCALATPCGGWNGSSLLHEQAPRAFAHHDVPRCDRCDSGLHRWIEITCSTEAPRRWTDPNGAEASRVHRRHRSAHREPSRLPRHRRSTIDGAQLGLADALGLPDLSLLGGEAVRLIPSNFQASAVGAFIPGKVRVQFDIVIENKLPGINFITPTWPTPPSPGVILVPLEQVVTTTPGGVTGGDGNEVIVELPSYGLVEPSIDWSGAGTAGSGAPFSFFNDTNCGLATSNDCFRWEAYTSPVALRASDVRSA